MLLTEEQMKERAYHNEHPLENLPKEFETGKLMGDNVVVKSLYFELELKEDSEGGIIRPTYRTHETDGGKIVAKIDDYPWQDRGVVVMKGTGTYSDQLTIGQVVWLNPRLARHSDFLADRAAAVTKLNGYKLMPASSIELIENTVFIKD